MSTGYTEVFSWGGDHFGQLGLGGKETGKSYCIPRFCSFNVLIRQISCGDEHSGFITNNGLVYTIGNNADGRLGVGDRSIKFSASPCLVELPTSAQAVNISCGWGHSAVSFDDGSLYSWGLGDFGVLGTGDAETMWQPVKVPLGSTTKVASVSCGSRHTGILTYLGEIWLCGSGDAGQLGTGRRETETSLVKVPFDEEIAQIGCGIFHSGFVTRSGRVYTFGGNTFGQLGTGSKQSANIPTLVTDLAHVRISKIALGNHTAAVSETGDMYIWGSGIFGEFLSPQKVVSLKAPIKDITVGGSFGSALDVNNMVWSWGSNASGELGVGDYDPRVNPFPVVALQGKRVTKISCGGSFTIALGLDLTTPMRSSALSNLDVPTRTDNLNESTGLYRGGSQSPNKDIRTRGSASPLRDSPGRRAGSALPGRSIESRFPSTIKNERLTNPNSKRGERGSSQERIRTSNIGNLRSSNTTIGSIPQDTKGVTGYLGELRHELRRLHEGAGGIDELSNVVNSMNDKNEDLQRLLRSEQEHRKRAEDQLFETKRQTEGTITDISSRNQTVVQRYEQKMVDLDVSVAQRGQEISRLQDMHKRAVDEKTRAEMEAFDARKRQADMEFAGKQARDSVAKLESQARADAQTREQMSLQISDMDRMHRDDITKLEGRIVENQRQHHDEVAGMEARIAELDRRHRDELLASENAKSTVQTTLRNTEARVRTLELQLDEESLQRRQLWDELDVSSNQRRANEERLTAEIACLQREGERKDVSLAQAADNARQEAIRINDLETERRSLVVQIGDFKSQLDKLQVDIMGYAKDLDISKGSNIELTDIVEKLKADLNRARMDNDALTRENGNRRLENEKLSVDLNNSINDSLAQQHRLNQQIEDLINNNNNLKSDLVRSQADHESALQVNASLEGQLRGVQFDNEELRKTVDDVETKNKKLFAALEKALADRAREYKERTEDILGTSPGKSPMKGSYRDQRLRASRSPLIDKYANRSTDYAGGSLTQSMLDPRTPVNRSTTVTTSPLRNSQTYVTYGQSPAHNPRGRLSTEHMARIARSANKVVDDYDKRSPVPEPPAISVSTVEVISPLRETEQRPADQAEIKSNLEDIKAKLTSLQENKAALENKMAQFEIKLQKPESP